MRTYNGLFSLVLHLCCLAWLLLPYWIWFWRKIWLNWARLSSSLYIWLLRGLNRCDWLLYFCLSNTGSWSFSLILLNSRYCLLRWWYSFLCFFHFWRDLLWTITNRTLLGSHKRLLDLLRNWSCFWLRYRLGLFLCIRLDFRSPFFGWILFSEESFIHNLGDLRWLNMWPFTLMEISRLWGRYI